MRFLGRGRVFYPGGGGEMEVMLIAFFFFDRSIYGLVLNPNLKFLGPVTPIGGTALIAGWIALAVATRGRIALRS